MQRFFILFLFASILFACNHQVPNKESIDFSDTNQLVEKEYNTSDVFSIIKSRGDNIVEHLFKEGIKKDADLEQLLSKQEKLRDYFNSNTKPMNEYFNYNTSYYAQVKNVVQRMKDTVGRKRMAEFVERSEAAFLENSSDISNTLGRVNTLRQEVKAQREVLKVLVADYYIQQYQSKEPSLESMLKLQGEYEALIGDLKKKIEAYETK